MRWLLDTNVVSELRKRSGDPGVKAWVADRAAADMAISVVTVIEIEIGILLKARSDADQAALLRHWLETRVLAGFAGRILPLDLAVARRIAPLPVPDQAPRHHAFIAGTALARSLTVVTRNVRDFSRSGVEVVDPWSAG